MSWGMAVVVVKGVRPSIFQYSLSCLLTITFDQDTVGAVATGRREGDSNVPVSRPIFRPIRRSIARCTAFPIPMEEH